MCGGANDSLFLDLPLATGLLSDYSVTDITTDPSSDAGLLLSRGPLLGGEGSNINHWLLDIPLDTCNIQVDEEPNHADLHSPIHPPLFRHIGEQVGTQPPQAEDFINSIYGWDIPLIHALDSMYLTTSLPWFTESCPSAHMNTTANFSIPSILPSISHSLSSGRSSRRPTSVRRTMERPYSCNVCSKSYLRRSGLRRHRRESHEASLCMYGCDFEWGRPYRLKEHLERWHPGVNTDAVLGEAMKTRRRAKVIAGHRGG